MKIWKCAVVLSAAIMTSVTAHSDSSFPGEQYYSEDFETAADYGENIIFTEVDGNHALRVCDGFSEPVCTPPANMLLEGKFKVLDIYENRSCFEIIPKSNKKGDEYFGGWRYNIFSIDLQRSFISSGSSIGGDVEIGGGWNYFKISTLGRKTIFEVNGTILCADSAQALPELVFRAEGCDVLVDDLQISKIITGGATYNGLAAAKTEHTISAHEPYDFLRESGLYRLYSGGTRVNDVNIDDVDLRYMANIKSCRADMDIFTANQRLFLHIRVNHAALKLMLMITNRRGSTCVIQRINGGSSFYRDFKSIAGENATYAIGKPPKGSSEIYGNYGGGTTAMGGIIFGKQLENDEKKLDKILEIINTINTDKELYNISVYGFEGEHWDRNENGVIISREGFASSAERAKIGAANIFSIGGLYPVEWRTQDVDELTKKKYEWAEKNTNYAKIENALPVDLEEMTQYSSLLDKTREQVYIEIITGEKPVDYFDEYVKEFLENGGQKIIDAANNWYDSFK